MAQAILGGYRYFNESIVSTHTAALTQPNLGEVLSGLFLPSFQSDELLTIVGLLGTRLSLTTCFSIPLWSLLL